MIKKFVNFEAKNSGQDGFVVETKTVSHFRDAQNDSNNKTKKILLLPLIIGFFSIVGLIFISTIIIFSWYSNRFQEYSNASLIEVYSQLTGKLAVDPFGESSTIHILVAGLDEIQNQREGSILTDTLLVITIQKDGNISLLSIPRDLWIDSLQTKINALYYYG